jgi:hypothetical protein
LRFKHLAAAWSKMRRIAAGKSGEVFGLTNAEAGRVPLLSQVDRDINRRY